MEERINYEELPDREILVLVARSCNQTERHLAKQNTEIEKQGTRLTKVESFIKYVKWSAGLGGSGTLLAGVLKIIGLY